MYYIYRYGKGAFMAESDTYIHELALNYFIEHQDELCEKYNGKELLMRGAPAKGASAAYI